MTDPERRIEKNMNVWIDKTALMDKSYQLLCWCVCKYARSFEPDVAKGSFTNYVDKILAFFHCLLSCVDIFYGMNFEKKCTFLEHLTTKSCKRSLWMTLRVSKSWSVSNNTGLIYSFFKTLFPPSSSSLVVWKIMRWLC